MKTKNNNVSLSITWMTWAVWVENIALAFIISFTFYTTLPVQTKKQLSIPVGATSKTIISQLNTRGYDVGFIDTFILSKMSKNRKGHIRKGELKFRETVLNRIDFLYALTKAKMPLFKITLIPGETTEIFLGLVAERLGINQSKLLTAYESQSKYPEAGISADTYLAPKHMNEEKLMKFLLASSERKYKKLSTEAYGDYNQTKWLRILTIASIIQKEAANNKEMPLVSSVIYNRLKKNMRLQMDGTLNYGKYSHIKVTPKRIKTDMSTFNTYKHKGLPLSPIGSVSPIAIDAALHPASTDYLYFMRNKDGVHDFTDTFKKHRQNIKEAK